MIHRLIFSIHPSYTIFGHISSGSRFGSVDKTAKVKQKNCAKCGKLLKVLVPQGKLGVATCPICGHKTPIDNFRALQKLARFLDGEGVARNITLVLLLVWPVIFLVNTSGLEKTRSGDMRLHSKSYFKDIDQAHHLGPASILLPPTTQCRDLGDIDLPTLDQLPIPGQPAAFVGKAPNDESLKALLGFPPVVVLLLFGGAILLFMYRVIKKSSTILASFGSGLLLFVAVSLGGSWGLMKWVHVKGEEKNLPTSHAAFYAVEFIDNVFGLYEPWLYPESTNYHVFTHFYASQIRHALERGDYDKALLIANEKPYRELRASRVAAYWHVAHQANQANRHEMAFASAKRAYELSPRTFSKDELALYTQPWLLETVKQGDFDRSLELLSVVENRGDAALSLWMGTVQAHLIDVLGDKKADVGRLNQVANVLGSYFTNTITTFGGKIRTSVGCLYLAIVQDLGQVALASNLAAKTIQALAPVAEKLQRSDRGNLTLSQAYSYQAVDEFQNHNYEKSVQNLEAAFRLTPNNEDIPCQLSLALSEAAIDKAYLNEFDSAKTMRDRSRALCSLDNIEEAYSLIDLVEGQLYLRKGNWSKASDSLNAAQKISQGENGRLAKNLLTDLKYGAKKRAAMLNEARKWVQNIPHVTGSSCQEFDKRGRCKVAHFYRQDKLIGIYEHSGRRFTFEVGNDVLVLKDALGDGRIDTADQAEGLGRRVIVEKDGDYRLDRELILSGTGSVIKDEKYSGKILVDIPSGAISESHHDFGSAPDAYLTVKHNGYYVGHTNTAKNQTFPRWYQGFVIDFKRGDRIVINMYDEDTGLPWDEDDYIDTFLIRELPQSDLKKGRNRQAAIELRVTPTRLPPGVYDIKRSEYVNTMLHADFSDYHDPEIRKMVENAHRSVKTNENMSLITSWALPEMATFAAFPAQGLLTKLLISAAGSAGTHEVLKNQDH